MTLEDWSALVLQAVVTLSRWGVEKEAKELKKKCDYSETYWFRLNKALETSWETAASIASVNRNKHTNANKCTRTYTYLSCVLILPVLFGKRGHSFLIISSDYSGHGFSPAPPVKSMSSRTEIWLETPSAVVIPSCSESQTHFSQS